MLPKECCQRLASILNAVSSSSCTVCKRSIASVAAARQQQQHQQEFPHAQSRPPNQIQLQQDQQQQHPLQQEQQQQYPLKQQLQLNSKSQDAFTNCNVLETVESPTASEQQAKAAGGFVRGVSTNPSGLGFKKTFYKRTLPSPPATAFASLEGRKLFAEALASGHTNGFFKLMEQFSTQDEPAFCGLASLAMVLNALAIDPRRTWKGSWRWFHEQMLDCCRPLEDVKQAGITLTHAACLSRCNGARVDLHRYGTFTLDELRQQVVDVCSTGEDHLVVSYSRRTFGQTGDGHFSPIGGYHAGKDLVLILDVARFKYPPHWVPLPMLFEAMQYLDPVTSQPRGFLRMSAAPLQGSVLMTLDMNSAGAWQAAHAYARTGARGVLQGQLANSTGHSTNGSEGIDVIGIAVAALVQHLPLSSTNAFLAVRQQQQQQQQESPHVCSSPPGTMSQQQQQQQQESPHVCSSPPGTMSQQQQQQQESPHVCSSPSGTMSQHQQQQQAPHVCGSAPSTSSSSAPDFGSSGTHTASTHTHGFHHLSSRAGPLSSSGQGSCQTDVWIDPDSSSASEGGRGGGGSAASRESAATGGMLAAVVDDSSDRCVPHQARAQLLAELHATPLYQLVLSQIQQLGVGQQQSSTDISSAADASVVVRLTGDGGNCSMPVGSSLHTVQGSGALGGDSANTSSNTAEVNPSPGFLAEKAAILLLLQSPAQWGALPWPSSEAAQQWDSLIDVSAYSILGAEAEFHSHSLVCAAENRCDTMSRGDTL